MKKNNTISYLNQWYKENVLLFNLLFSLLILCAQYVYLSPLPLFVLHLLLFVSVYCLLEKDNKRGRRRASALNRSLGQGQEYAIHSLLGTRHIPSSTTSSSSPSPPPSPCMPSPLHPMRNGGWTLTDYEVFLLSLQFISFGFLRILLFLFLLSIGYICCYIGLEVGNDHYDPRGESPLSHWRYSLTYINKYLSQLALFLIGYFDIEREGTPAPRSSAPIIISNHVSYVDSFPLIATHFPSPLGAIEHLNIPLVSTMVKAFHCVFVDRSNKAKNEEVVRVIKQRALSPLPWPQLLIFPEGTCSNGRQLISFKTGAFQPGAPIQPICLIYHRHLSPLPSFPSSFDPSWVNEGPAALPNLIRFFSEPIKYLKILYFPVYYPSPLEQRSPALYADNVRSLMSSHSGLSLSEMSYGDVQLQRIVSSSLSSVPHTAFVPLKSLLERYTHIKAKDIEGLLRSFILFSEGNKGKCLLNVREALVLLGINEGDQEDMDSTHVCERYLLMYLIHMKRNKNIGWYDLLLVYCICSGGGGGGRGRGEEEGEGEGGQREETPLPLKRRKNLLSICFLYFNYFPWDYINFNQFSHILKDFFYGSIEKYTIIRLFQECKSMNLGKEEGKEKEREEGECRVEHLIHLMEANEGIHKHINEAIRLHQQLSLSLSTSTIS